MTRNELSGEEVKELLAVIKSRFEKNTQRHEGIGWSDVRERLENNSEKLYSLAEMERTGGEPDVVGFDAITGNFMFIDCSKESPKDRRSLCYDQKALEDRKKFKPKDSAVAMAESMGVELLTEEQYRHLQTLGEFDTKTSSWLKTPDEVRKLGGAIYGDKRYGRTFVYHNGADSYYGSRGFRTVLLV